MCSVASAGFSGAPEAVTDYARANEEISNNSRGTGHEDSGASGGTLIKR